MSRIAVRRAHADDQKAITALVTNAGGTPKLRKRWGAFNLAALVELGYLAVVAYEATDAEDMTVLGFAVLSDAPPKEPDKCERWFAALSAAKAATDAVAAEEAAADPEGPAGLAAAKAAKAAPSAPLLMSNSLFVEFLVVEPSFGHVLLDQMLQTVFTTLPEVDYVIAALAPGEGVPDEVHDAPTRRRWQYRTADERRTTNRNEPSTHPPPHRRRRRHPFTAVPPPTPLPSIPSCRCRRASRRSTCRSSTQRRCRPRRTTRRSRRRAARRAARARAPCSTRRRSCASARRWCRRCSCAARASRTTTT
jgi:hypothetical protein